MSLLAPSASLHRARGCFCNHLFEALASKWENGGHDHRRTLLCDAAMPVASLLQHGVQTMSSSLQDITPIDVLQIGDTLHAHGTPAQRTTAPARSRVEFRHLPSLVIASCST